MKRTLIIVFMLIVSMVVLCGCQKEAQMVEDLASTIMSTEDKKDNTNNGTVTDNDGHIGNEKDETTRKETTEATKDKTDNAM